MSGPPAPRSRMVATAMLLLMALGRADGEEVRLAVTRDTWFSIVGSEADANLGGAPKLKLKSYQEMSLIDVDPAPLKGRVVTRATLYLRSMGEPRLLRVTVGTIAADWVEGTSTSYAQQIGASTFRHRRHPDLPWTLAGGDLCDVILGRGGSFWRSADASAPDADGWQAVAVGPTIVAARIAGISAGFLLFDDTGSEWTRDGDKWTPRPFPNRFVASRDANRASAPYLTVELGPEDRLPPEPPTLLPSEVADLPAGEAYASWMSPIDRGPAGTIGFLVAIDGRQVFRHLIPSIGPPDRPVRMHVRDLGLAPGSKVALSVRAVDAAGNISSEGRGQVLVSDRVARPLPGAPPEAPIGVAKPPSLGGATVAILDELDKIDPGSGRIVGEAGPASPGPGHLWDPKTGRIALQAAGGETVGFQLAFRGPVSGLRPSLTFEKRDGPGIGVEFGRVEVVATGRGPIPDPVVPIAGPVDFPDGPGGGSLLVEVHVPHASPAGERRGALTLRTGSGTVTIEVGLMIWGFDLPDRLTFLPEMNCYDLPDDERAYYRMAHDHRVALDRVPYSQRGEVAPGMAPPIVGGRFDWTAWDARFGPFFDGSAFEGSRRGPIPVEVFYLPMHENWPTPIGPAYNGDYWADRAFPESYRLAFVAATRKFADHLAEKRWRGTIFLGFLNNKNDFKRGQRGWAGGSSPWLLDEPASFQDFWALRYYAGAFREGVAQARPGAMLAFRADISRPQWQRDSLDGLLDYNVVGGEFRNRSRMVLDRKRADGQLALEYGTANPVEEPNVRSAAWCLDAWSLGLDGVIPWQTIGRPGSWREGDELALFYPPRGPDQKGPAPSIRLKAFRRGQQDVEYLALLAALEGEPRWAIGARVREALRLDGRREGAEGEAAGSIRQDGLRSRDLHDLRSRVGKALSDARAKAAGNGLDWTPRERRQGR